MSALTIRQLLEQRVAAMTPALATAWENVLFEPPDAPWQDVTLMLDAPQRPTLGSAFWRQRGHLQILLVYPLNTGVATVMARAELIRTTFPQGLTLSSGSVRILLETNAEIARGRELSGWYQVPVTIPFTADINA